MQRKQQNGTYLPLAAYDELLELVSAQDDGVPVIFGVQPGVLEALFGSESVSVNNDVYQSKPEAAGVKNVCGI